MSADIVLAFRDFFAARDAVSLATAYTTLQTLGAIQDAPDSTTLNWQEEEFTFNRLFVGPMAPVAPPYASVWLTSERLLMTEDTLAIRDFYTLLGLQTPLQNSAPDDFLPYELESYAALCALRSPSLDRETAAALYEALHWLVAIHWQRWLPPFLQAARAADALTPAVRALLISFENWLAETFSEIGVSFHIPAKELSCP